MTTQKHQAEAHPSGFVRRFRDLFGIAFCLATIWMLSCFSPLDIQPQKDTPSPCDTTAVVLDSIPCPEVER